tara:strand:- start:994 stop:1164 length:171 start_codon:yes stop_codon:yes gene_type:complete
MFDSFKFLQNIRIDRAAGNMSMIEGEGFWKNYEEYKCTYAVEYVNKVIFVPAQCKN